VREGMLVTHDRFFGPGTIYLESSKMEGPNHAIDWARDQCCCRITVRSCYSKTSLRQAAPIITGLIQRGSKIRPRWFVIQWSRWSRCDLSWIARCSNTRWYILLRQSISPSTNWVDVGSIRAWQKLVRAGLGQQMLIER
jgi:hypothetical protein